MSNDTVTLGTSWLRERPEILTPGERARPSRRRRTMAYLLAVLLPPATALVLLPLRAHHDQIVALVLVVPVVVVALLGATGPAFVAALSAAFAFDVAHTRPYWHPVIYNPDDIATALALVAVGLTVGVLCHRVAHLSERANGRHDELRHLLHFTRTVTECDALDEEALAADVCRHLTALLELRQCRWQAGPGGAAGAVLLPTGAVMGSVSSLNPDRAKLPDHLDVPAETGAGELGRFVLTPDSDRVVSAEERLTAATIVGLFAHEIARQRI